MKRSSNQKLWLNPSHELSRGLSDCVVFDDGGGLRPVNQASTLGIVTPGASAPGWRASPGGVGAYVSGGSGFEIPNHQIFGTNNWSIRCLFYPITLAGTYTIFLEKSTADGDGNRDFLVCLNGSGNISYLTIAGGGADPSDTCGMAPGKLYDFVMTKSGTTISFYVNGILKGSATMGGAASIAGKTMIGGTLSSGNTNIEAVYHLYQSWIHRALTPSEILSLYHEPYQMFTKPRQRSVKAAAGGGGSTQAPRSMHQFRQRRVLV